MSILGKAFRPRAEAPVPYSPRRAGSAFGNSTGASGPMAQMGQVATLFAVVDRICTAATGPDWDLYRTPKTGGDDAERERVEVEQHAAAKVWAHPNPHMTQAALIETVQQHIELSPTGDGFLIVVKAGKIPVELWPVRPDRMSEVPDPQDFLKGWVYKSPDGDKIPLDVDDVIHIKGTPDPTNPYRGLGRVTSLMRDLESSTAAAEWSANFFKNSAQPGGLIEVDTALTDDEFDQMRTRWQEQHRGVANAHRVAILEHGKWVDRAYSMRDMEFTALRNLSRDQIYEAWGINRAIMGQTDGVNYAAAKAARGLFAELITEPRLERWKQALNNRLLPMFGATGKGVEFDFESPVPEDADEENAARDSNIRAVTALVAAGWNPSETAAAFGLPEIQFGDGTDDPNKGLLTKLVIGAPSLAPLILPLLGVELDPEALDQYYGNRNGGQQDNSGDTQDKQPDPSNQAPPPAKGTPPPPPPDGQAPEAHHHPHIRNEDSPPDVDLSGLDERWRHILDQLLARWADFTAAVRAQLRNLIKQAIDDDDLPALARLEVDATQGTDTLNEALLAMAAAGAVSAVNEGEAAGVTLTAAAAADLGLGVTAEVVAVLLADDLANTAGREALRQHTPGKSGDQVAADVDAVMREQSTAQAQAQLGGALTGASNAGRVATFLSGPVGSLYADEQMDGNTCKFCAAINGRFICTTEDLSAYDRLYTAFGGYKDCLGGVRCRGTVTGVWRPEQAPESERPGVGVGES